MRLRRGGVARTAAVIEDDLEDRDTGLHKPHIQGLADLVASVLACRSVNTSEIATVLPRRVGDAESRYRYIHRWLSNEKIDPLSVMEGFVPEILWQLGNDGRIAVLMLDQSKISEGFECLMVSLRVADRAIPLGWRVVETSGAIGFKVQEGLLNAIAAMVPENVDILLTADRFYGTVALIEWAQRQHWQYRIRLKSNLLLTHEGGEISTGDAAKAGMKSLLNVQFNGSKICSHIGILQEKGYAEPWIIAMSEVPSDARVLDYGMRWGIEALFSDLKSRGFRITETKLKDPKRIERLLLVLTIATYWAVSTGMANAQKVKSVSKKKRTDP